MTDSEYSPKNFFDKKYILICGLDYQDFYSFEEFHDIRDTYKTANTEKFHKYMQRLMDDTIVTEYIASNDVGEGITVEIFRKRFIHVFLQEILNMQKSKTDIVKLIISEYNFVPDDYFIEHNLHIILFNNDLFVFFHNNINMEKYINRIALYFKNFIADLTIKQIQNFIDVGYDIIQLCKLSDPDEGNNILENCIFNTDINVFIFLLDSGIDFHKYETKLLRSCVESCRNNHLRGLIERGANLKLLHNIKIDDKEGMNTYKTLLEHDIDIDTIIYLLSRK